MPCKSKCSRLRLLASLLPSYSSELPGTLALPDIRITDCQPISSHATLARPSSASVDSTLSTKISVGRRVLNLLRSRSPSPVRADAPSAGQSQGNAPESAPLPGNLKKTVLGATKLALQTAASVLKLAPIPNLGQIPTLLLDWIQIYEVCEQSQVSLSMFLIPLAFCSLSKVTTIASGSYKLRSKKSSVQSFNLLSSGLVKFLVS